MEKSDLVLDYKSQIENLRSHSEQGEFNHLKNQIYLDYAANCVYPSSLIKQYYQKLTTHDESSGSWSLFSNPHSQSQSGLYTNLFVESTRQKILQLFNTNLNEYDVVFVQNATHGMKLLLESFNFGTIDPSQEKSKPCANPYFAYLNDNHTSVIGLRELVWSSNPGVEVHFLAESKSSECFFDSKLIENPYQNQQVMHSCPNNLLVIPAQSNFNGRRYSLDLIDKIKSKGINPQLKKENLFLCLDTASYTSTSFLNLNEIKADFLVVSFYKMFGFPTGIGALIIRKTEATKNCLSAKKYFGGGTVSMALIDKAQVCFKNCSLKQNGKSQIKIDNFHEFFEDGTISYLQIIGLNLAIEKFFQLTFGKGFMVIEEYVAELTEYCLAKLEVLKHYNGTKMVEIYRKDRLDLNYGPIIAFNLKNSSGKYIGYNLVNSLAQENRIHLRTGCFCNIGACQLFLTHLKDSKDFLENFEEHGHKCGDYIDLIDGKPTGAIRISFGYASTKCDIDYFLKFLQDNFVETKAQNFDQVNIKSGYLGKQFMTITQIFIYPIKSCRAMKIEDSWPLIKDFGLKYDRNFVIVDNDGIVLTQKRCPNLTRLQPYIDLGKQKMTLSHLSASFSLELNTNFDKTIVFANKIAGYDMGDEVSEWLTKVLNFSDTCRLLKIAESVEKASYANKAEFLLISENSIRVLRRFLVENLEENIKNKIGEIGFVKIDNFLLLQFRPNLIVSIDENTSGDFSEEFWTDIKILNKNITFKSVNNCTRCQMININQSEDNDSKNNDSTDYSFLCNSLLKQVNKFKSNSKFGIYLAQSENNAEIQFGDFSDNFEKKSAIGLGDIGVANFKK
ncbi:molybdenum cofactor sulfurase [Brachionus plicatilis]|uniref:Molybdenum cofactor sulfurase n=1 Tax=Brachionus plicatilis TaxID=10195 RepID=A0A3M7RPF2_BRAPC|nr:molybdenum cofactor sulfurase [Brachionus plicatilis]